MTLFYCGDLNAPLMVNCRKNIIQFFKVPSSTNNEPKEKGGGLAFVLRQVITNIYWVYACYSHVTCKVFLI